MKMVREKRTNSKTVLMARLPPRFYNPSFPTPSRRNTGTVSRPPSFCRAPWSSHAFEPAAASLTTHAPSRAQPRLPPSRHPCAVIAAVAPSPRCLRSKSTSPAARPRCLSFRCLVPPNLSHIAEPNTKLLRGCLGLEGSTCPLITSMYGRDGTIKRRLRAEDC